MADKCESIEDALGRLWDEANDHEYDDSENALFWEKQLKMVERLTHSLEDNTEAWDRLHESDDKDDVLGELNDALKSNDPIHKVECVFTATQILGRYV